MTAMTWTSEIVDTLGHLTDALVRGLAVARSADRRHLVGGPAARRKYHAAARPALSDRMLLLAPPMAR